MKSSRIIVGLALCVLLPITCLAQRRGSSNNSNRGPGSNTRPSPNSGTVGSGSSAAGGHHADDEGTVTFHSQTVLIQVPVVVTAKGGGHLHGLTSADFHVLENGKEQKVAGFEEINQPAALASAAQPAAPADEISNLSFGRSTPRNVIVVVLDTINTPFLDQAQGRSQLIKYLAQNVEGGQATALVLMSSRGVKIVHPFTADPSLLVAALKKSESQIPAMQDVPIDAQAAAGTDQGFESPIAFASVLGQPQDQLDNFLQYGDPNIARMQQDRAIEATMRGFLEISWALSGIPGRKSLIWATGGFPFYLDSPAAVPSGYLAVLYERAMQSLNDAEISIYPVDVRGLVNYSPISDVTYKGAVNGPAMAGALASRGWLHYSTLDTLKEFAEMTGGRAFYNSNDLAGGFRRAADDSSSYYMLSYYLDTSNHKAGWRPLKVKVDKPHSEVRARNGFFVTSATLDPAANRKTDVQTALSSPFDSTGIGMKVYWRGTSQDGAKKKVDFALQLAPNGLTLDDGGDPRLDVDVLYVAVKNGATADSFAQTIQGKPKPQTLEKLHTDGLAYTNSLQLEPGKYMVRFVVRDNLSGKVGSLSTPLSVN